jgi:hypothetical protein
MVNPTYEGDRSPIPKKRERSAAASSSPFNPTNIDRTKQQSQPKNIKSNCNTQQKTESDRNSG